MSQSRLAPWIVALLCLGVVGCSGTPNAANTSPANTSPTNVEPGPSWVESAVAHIRVDTGDAGGMRGCTGSLTPEARAFFSKVYAEASKCGTADPSAKGSVTFHSTLEEGGGLSEFSVLDDK